MNVSKFVSNSIATFSVKIFTLSKSSKLIFYDYSYTVAPVQKYTGLVEEI